MKSPCRAQVLNDAWLYEEKSNPECSISFRAVFERLHGALNLRVSETVLHAMSSVFRDLAMHDCCTMGVEGSLRARCENRCSPDKVGPGFGDNETGTGVSCATPMVSNADASTHVHMGGLGANSSRTRPSVALGFAARVPRMSSTSFAHAVVQAMRAT